MAQRLGMADGRCATVNVSTRLFNDQLFKKGNIDTFDNFGYRKFLQSSSPEDIIPDPDCLLYSYNDKDFNLIESTNVISQNDKTSD